MKYPDIKENNYEKAKRDAKEFYSRIGQISCPGAGIKIIFNRAGFQHLIRKGKIQRSKSEQIWRFSLLIYARLIIESYDAEITHKTKVLGNTEADFWIFKQRRDEIPVTVVVRRIGNGKAHFFSIY
jgi:hypothetical protein